MPKYGLSVIRILPLIGIRFCPNTGKYCSQKVRICAYFMQYWSGVSIADFEQVKYAKIPAFSDPYTFSDTEAILSKYGKILLRGSRYLGIFHAVLIWCFYCWLWTGEICQNTGFLWSVYFLWYRGNSVQIRENTAQRKSVFGHISRSIDQVIVTREVLFTICGCWLIQNLDKRKKRNKFKGFQIEAFFLPNISAP